MPISKIINGRWIIMTMLAFLLTACGSDDTSSGGGVLQLTIADSGKSVTISQNMKIALSLEGNPSTPYRWDLLSGTGTVLAQTGEPVYTPKSTDPLVVGGSGTYLYTFAPLATGSATLKLSYHPVYSQTPVQTFEVAVVVAP